MKRITGCKVLAVAVAILFLVSCSKPRTVAFTYVKHGSYKVIIRDLEFFHSGIHNTDVCVADLNDNHFPSTKGFQCFLSGHDFVGLGVQWQSAHAINIHFKCGTVSSFSNFAIISKNRDIPIDFHIFMHDLDDCKSGQ